ncbi:MULTISPECIES: UTP--glucose-1-phosphate uridylyltransferase GalU [unclassified Methanosarcina]|uniref:UTP--glucose-1-phosphate uridylyltransferase GalU n=1 Tax=unclassified Methanosarcina TaxID=2644672 RepID=UPI0006154BE0|nr:MULTISPECIES: UTP--glucose-1-phosphate uridylyltransferase GalU [unclassified Methanosarcina]AKB18887.1 UTP--glucose-1-phosphate uridylyltransferase [Methanosarcina sp. WWM596]AKB23239.1 UTP--glucose-1-phosphate uridylyltransferase [Methanosarcina sp. WH1]
MTIKKALIPAAGLGTRFLPATKSMPKEMLPIIDTPVIQYVVEEAIASGIEDIIIITGRGKRAIEDYFDDSPELEMHLAKKHNTELLKLVRDVSSLVDIHYIRQKEPNGLGDAVLRAEKHIGNEPFAVLLGDDIIVNDEPCTAQLIENFKKYGRSTIAVEEVPYEKLNSYGIIKGKPIDNSLYVLEDIVEKPSLEAAPSNIGAIGRYVFTPEIFDCIKEAGTGVGSEIQLTDGIRLLNKSQMIYACRFKGKRFDTGDRLGYVKSIVDFALKNESLRNDVLEYLREILAVEKVPAEKKEER